MNNVNKLKELINSKFASGDLENLELYIDEYCKLNPYDVDNFSMKAILYYCKGNYEEAEKEIEKIINKFQFNFDLNYNLAMISFAKKDYIKALKYYCISSYLSNDNKDDIVKSIDYILENKLVDDKKGLNIIKEQRDIFELSYRNFPQKIDGSYVGDMLYRTPENEGYFVSCYDYYLAQRDGVLLENQQGSRLLYKTECLFAKETKYEEMNLDEKHIVPLCLKEKPSSVNMVINDERFDLSNNIPNRFYYYPVEKANIKICSDKDIVIGSPIKVHNNPDKRKLVLNIFIDGLSQKFIEERGLENLMPNTYRYFSKGTICNNVYVTGEWTYVNLASFFMGDYMTNHGMFHPNFNACLDNKKLTLGELFKKDGYFTSKIDGDWRSVPTYGYIRGIDRYIYQPAVRGMNLEEIITETIEHIEAFKELDKFLWVCISDLHDVPDEFEGRLITQVNDDVKNRVLNDKNNLTSVRQTFDKKKIARYETQIKRVDIYLGMLLNYLEQNFKDEEILVSLISDHGQGFLIEKDKEFLCEKRTKVPFMFRGKGIKMDTCNELIEGIDLMPILLKHSDIEYNMDNRDCNLPKYFGGNKEREYTYTESIFPGSIYRAAINDKFHEFLFQTEGLVGEDGRFEVGNYSYVLSNKLNGNDEKEMYADKVDLFLNIIFNHIKENIII